MTNYRYRLKYICFYHLSLQSMTTMQDISKIKDDTYDTGSLTIPRIQILNIDVRGVNSPCTDCRALLKHVNWEAVLVLEHTLTHIKGEERNSGNPSKPMNFPWSIQKQLTTTFHTVCAATSKSQLFKWFDDWDDQHRILKSIEGGYCFAKCINNYPNTSN